MNCSLRNKGQIRKKMFGLKKNALNVKKSQL